MRILFSLPLLIVGLFLFSIEAQNVPMSPCIFARITNYTTPKSKAATGVNTSTWGGTCHFGGAQKYLPAWYTIFDF